jgi:signal transduction histidine kinase/DNA-binding response OmpR family regulator
MDAPHDHPPEPALNGPDDSPARVLVVDDEASVIELFRDFFASHDYELTVAMSGEEAVRMLREARPEIVLTDINLPGMSGLEVMREAKRVDPDVSVIVVTGHASASSAIDALRQGAYDYITKPFDLDEVHQLVGRGVANRRLKLMNQRLLAELREKNEILRHHEQALRERVRIATWQMTRLYEVGKEISANLELVPRLAVIGAKSAELSGAGAAILYLKHEDSGDFRAASSAGIELRSDADNRPHLIPAGHPLRRSIDEQVPVHMEHAGAGEPVMPGASGGPHNVLALPMIAEGNVMGVLAVLDKQGGFTGDDESFLALFASQSAIAVRNSQLFDHTKSLDRLKSEFVAVVSHEIRTPLTSVKGAVELLSDDRYFQNGEQQTKLLTIAHANAERLLVLINDILDFSKLEAASLPMSMERQRLEPVVQQAVHRMSTQLQEKRIECDTVLSADLPDLMIDSGRVAQVLTNLLSNAIKFSPVGGRIEITAERDGDGVRVGVRDSGEGIAQEDLPRLFQKFTQIDSSATRKAGGTGLGLVICKGIVEQHGGRIWVESTPNVGSTFFFTLPAADRLGDESDDGGLIAA